MMKTKNGKRIGRPPIDPRKRKGTLLAVRVTDSENERIREEAERRGVTISDLLLESWRDNEGDTK